MLILAPDAHGCEANLSERRADFLSLCEVQNQQALCKVCENTNYFTH